MIRLHTSVHFCDRQLKIINYSHNFVFLTHIIISIYYKGDEEALIKLYFHSMSNMSKPYTAMSKITLFLTPKHFFLNQNDLTTYLCPFL